MIVATLYSTVLNEYINERIRPRRFHRKVEGFRESDTQSTWETISKFDLLRDFEAFDDEGNKIAISNDKKRLQKLIDQQKK